ncbi:hypothetical protein GCM10023084_24270 [Streptomyces lacrimifluminis]|uniref:Uncharacterized protein n=1 Tax=Streptomyces lacrimifluminis TaxID=1500077 RepID=A0A917NQB3_9ACTN|nr:hypothetical protein GCM10012282_08990 [Streptomyces lacrimifluminis]
MTVAATQVTGQRAYANPWEVPPEGVLGVLRAAYRDAAPGTD